MHILDVSMHRKLELVQRGSNERLRVRKATPREVSRRT